VGERLRAMQDSGQIPRDWFLLLGHNVAWTLHKGRWTYPVFSNISKFKQVGRAWISDLTLFKHYKSYLGN
jgi:hypothetical protein